MEEKTQKQIRNTLIFIATILLLALFKITASFSICVVLSVFIFIFIWPFAAALEKYKIPKTIASIICIVLIIAIILGFGWFLVFSVDSLFAALPKYAGKMLVIDESLTSFLRRWIEIPENSSFFALIDIDWMNYIVKTLGTISSSVISITKNLFLTILLSAFLLIERNSLIPKITSATHEDSRSRVSIVIQRVKKQVSKYLVEKVVISLITGALFYLVAFYVKLDFAELWGILAFLMNFIPTIGSIVITITTIGMALIQFLPDWTPVLFVAVSTIAIQNILGNIIEPRIQGTTLNLSPFIILVSLSLFNFIWGVIGMFLAVPLLSVLEIVFANMESTKGIATILSSGFSFKRKMRKEKQKNRQPDLFDDVSLPEDDE